MNVLKYFSALVFLPWLCLVTPVSGAGLQPAGTNEDNLNGPPVYLAALHQRDGRQLLHWKYNISRPEFVAVRVVDGAGLEVAQVRRPIRQRDVTGFPGPFQLFPLKADGQGEPAVVAAGLPAAPVPSISRIGIRQLGGRAEFVALATGGVFHPAGMNYVPLRFGDHAAFEAATSTSEGCYDPLEAEAMLDLMRASGYNCVRVFLNPGRRPQNPGMTGEPDTAGLYAPYLDNLADFLQKSAASGIHVIFNFGDFDLPHNNYFRAEVAGKEGPGVVFSTHGLIAFREMVVSTLAYLRTKNPGLLKVILGVQFVNENAAHLAAWPFNTPGPVRTANGKTYDLNTAGGRARCYEQGLAFFYRQVCAAVKSVDPMLLTCDGVFVAHAVGRDYRRGEAVFEPDQIADGFQWDKAAGYRVPPSLVLLAQSPLDFVDVHLYPAGKLVEFEPEVADLLESSRFQAAVAAGLGLKKPVILGEFGAFKKDVANDTGDLATRGLRRWRETRRLACQNHGFAGYFAWSLETFDQTDIYQALAFGPGFLEKFCQECTWAAKDQAASAPSEAGALNPLVLEDVAPLGRGHGFLVKQSLQP